MLLSCSNTGTGWACCLAGAEWKPLRSPERRETVLPIDDGDEREAARNSSDDVMTEKNRDGRVTVLSSTVYFALSLRLSDSE